jgi:hypothetical protein
MDMISLAFIAEMCGDRIVAQNGGGGKRICYSLLNIHADWPSGAYAPLARLLGSLPLVAYVWCGGKDDSPAGPLLQMRRKIRLR